MKQKVIITAAITGAATFPSQSEYLPITPEEIITESLRAYEAGAAIVHIHARDPKTGHPSSDAGIFGEILSGIKAKCDVVIGTTTGGGVGMTPSERLSVVTTFKPELASFNLGSMNFGLFPIAESINNYRFDWEKSYIEGTKDFVFKNTFADLEYFCQEMERVGTKPEGEIYDVGHLYNVRYLTKRNFWKMPIHFQYVMGVLGGISGTAQNLMFLKNTADQLFERNYTWSVIGTGYPAEFDLGTLAVLLGGHVRVGMEDNLRLDWNNPVKSNGELVDKMVRIIRSLDREIAAPDEARKILGLKGKDKVNF